MTAAQQFLPKSEFNNDEKNYLSAALVVVACLLGSLLILLVTIICH